MTILFVIIGVLLSIYFWSVLGLYVYCKEKSFNKAISDIWYIPLVFVMYPCMLIFSRRSIPKRQVIACYLRMPEKLVFFTIAHELYPLVERMAYQKKKGSKQYSNIFGRISDMWKVESAFISGCSLNGYNFF